MVVAERLGFVVVTLATAALAAAFVAFVAQGAVLAEPEEFQGRVPVWVEEERCS